MSKTLTIFSLVVLCGWTLLVGLIVRGPSNHGQELVGTSVLNETAGHYAISFGDRLTRFGPPGSATVPIGLKQLNPELETLVVLEFERVFQVHVVRHHPVVDHDGHWQGIELAYTPRAAP